MPTANNLVAALCLAFLGAILAELVKPQMPEGYDFGYFTLVSAALGLVVGWKVMGPRAGKGGVMAINNGVTGVLALVIVGLLVFGANEMLARALKRRYDEPIEAIQQIVELAVEFSLYLMDAKVIGVLVIGAVVSGALTEAAYRRWR
ncbi:TrgA family protein [Thiosulfatihalobacter marinus]|jgi:high-affinity Fe2+/Pb2+ permease|uniref:TrgA family protein n=1 Tax=Thiosulfatihalobacter marinus TaxID=2792481 RepID=UPI0018D5D236|nr:TrgA family protein [Thiosulfatihalobacter marinus]